jgi:hypothetical protein
VNVETKEQSKQWMHTYLPNKTKKSEQTLSACQKADGNCFLGHERSADGGIHSTRTTIMSEAYCKTLKKPHRAIKKRCGTLTSNAFIVLLHDNARSHTAAHT